MGTRLDGGNTQEVGMGTRLGRDGYQAGREGCCTGGVGQVLTVLQGQTLEVCGWVGVGTRLGGTQEMGTGTRLDGGNTQEVGMGTRLGWDGYQAGKEGCCTGGYPSLPAWYPSPPPVCHPHPAGTRPRLLCGRVRGRVPTSSEDEHSRYVLTGHTLTSVG